MSATVMSFCNQKGGVGKTSTTALVSYNLSKLGYKTLVIDFDPQANITQLFLKTKTRGQSAVATINKSLMTVLQNEEPLTNAILSINENLDLIPTAVDFSLYGRFLENKESDEKSRVAYFRKLLEEQLIDHYDFIFIDVPPTLGLSNDTAFYACDQIIIVLQTQERSLVGMWRGQHFRQPHHDHGTGQADGHDRDHRQRQGCLGPQDAKRVQSGRRGNYRTTEQG